MASVENGQEQTTGGYDQFIADQENGTAAGEEPSSPRYEKQISILDGLTEHRADRVGLLIANLPQEDLVHIVNKKMPAFLRIDKDIQRKRDELKDFHD